MAEARIDPAQLQQAVNHSLQRALARDRDVINHPILIGIIAYPNDGGRLDYKELRADPLVMATTNTTPSPTSGT